ncbi:hypothetical protein QN277_026535 [Acacia crassicarpa]|uniref:HSF-type DNA-binding domain-containing protein n=1 Tax=Acacia crassicarpa TaxID=499986 RepID=A0AAE1JAH2_9FABA|nr:hypothetical protein QN277_026535 [Acacia crassicarpa]
MAPSPVDHNSESTSSENQRSIPTPFLTKTYQLVDDLTIDDVISWNEDGSTFIVWNPTEFARDFLSKYFKHNNFSSFVRKLNTYGFKKVVGILERVFLPRRETASVRNTTTEDFDTFDANVACSEGRSHSDYGSFERTDVGR